MYYKPSGLNPCCSGSWVVSIKIDLSRYYREGLNPCCSGSWVVSVIKYLILTLYIVLILVVVEVGL